MSYPIVASTQSGPSSRLATLRSETRVTNLLLRPGNNRRVQATQVIDPLPDALGGASGTDLPYAVLDHTCARASRGSNRTRERSEAMALDFARDSSLRAVTNHASCELGGEAVLLNLDTGVYYGLDAVGTHIWKLLQEPRSITELRDLIVDEFDVAPARCEADLRPFVDSLHSYGLVVPHADAR